jgi:4-hydroxy-3-polyprenylbenzoate decarboxylase
MPTDTQAPVIIGISGATGAIYGIEALRMLRELEIESNLVITENGARTIAIETDMSIDEVRALADHYYSNKDMASAIASGSFRTRGMLVAPCSIKTLSAISSSFSANLLVRAADVMLKERRPLVLMVRETPLHKGHLRLMNHVLNAGAVLMPPVPAFYTKPETITDMVRHSVGRALDHLGIDHDLCERWSGDPKE